MKQLLVLLLLLPLSAAADGVKTFSWTNATQHTDGTVYDAATQQAFTHVYCNGDDIVPVISAPGAIEAYVSPVLAVGSYSCYAKHEHVNGQFSDASAPVAFDVLPDLTPVPNAPSGFGVN